MVELHLQVHCVATAGLTREVIQQLADWKLFPKVTTVTIAFHQAYNPMLLSLPITSLVLSSPISILNIPDNSDLPLCIQSDVKLLLISNELHLQSLTLLLSLQTVEVCDRSSCWICLRHLRLLGNPCPLPVIVINALATIPLLESLAISFHEVDYGEFEPHPVQEPKVALKSLTKLTIASSTLGLVHNLITHLSHPAILSITLTLTEEVPTSDWLKNVFTEISSTGSLTLERMELVYDFPSEFIGDGPDKDATPSDEEVGDNTLRPLFLFSNL